MSEERESTYLIQHHIIYYALFFIMYHFIYFSFNWPAQSDAVDYGDADEVNKNL